MRNQCCRGVALRVGIHPVVIAESELGDMQRQIFFGLRGTSDANDPPTQARTEDDDRRATALFGARISCNIKIRAKARVKCTGSNRVLHERDFCVVAHLHGRKLTDDVDRPLSRGHQSG
jgi:hypothetical protein